MWRRERARARETLSMMERQAPRLASSSRELMSWHASSIWSERGCVSESEIEDSDSIATPVDGTETSDAGEVTRISPESAKNSKHCKEQRASVDWV